MMSPEDSSPATLMLEARTPAAKLYSILNQLENYRDSDGKFQFKLCYPQLTWGKDGKTCNEWIQSSNIYTESDITDFQEIFLAFGINSLGLWKGLGKNSPGNDGATIIDDSPHHGNYYSAIGSKVYWMSSGNIPGPTHPTDSGANSPISKVEIYVLG